MLGASSVPFGAMLTLLWLVSAVIQRGLSLNTILNDYILFFCLFLGCLPQVVVVPFAVVAVLRNLQWWLRPNPPRRRQADRWRRRFWIAWPIGAISSVLINACFRIWLYVSRYGCVW